DDCMVAPDWIAEALACAAAQAGAGAFGGRVIPDWGRPPRPHLVRHAWLFAQQDHGDVPREVGSLVGAGIVVNRTALERVGWAERPWLADRTGHGYTSGGDVEISMRLQAGGYPLWFAPRLRILHRVADARRGLREMMRLAHGLGAGAELVSLLDAEDTTAWLG